MLNREELNKYGPPGFHLMQKEKDYMQHWILSFLSQSGFGGVFKGGTCLQKAFGLPRYSEDLDFTLNDAEKPDFDALSAYLSSAGFSGIIIKKTESNVSDTVKLRFRGPVYNGKTISEGSVTLDFSKRERTILEAKPVLITPPYTDILPYQIRVMDKEEMAAEKVRAIFTRKSARDLYDIYFLLHQKTVLRLEFIENKLAYNDLKFDYNAAERKIMDLEKIWDREMLVLTKNVLDFGLVSGLVLTMMKRLRPSE